MYLAWLIERRIDEKIYIARRRIEELTELIKRLEMIRRDLKELSESDMSECYQELVKEIDELFYCLVGRR